MPSMAPHAMYLPSGLYKHTVHITRLRYSSITSTFTMTHIMTSVTVDEHA